MRGVVNNDTKCYHVSSMELQAQSPLHTGPTRCIGHQCWSFTVPRKEDLCYRLLILNIQSPKSQYNVRPVQSHPGIDWHRTVPTKCTKTPGGTHRGRIHAQEAWDKELSRQENLLLNTVIKCMTLPSPSHNVAGTIYRQRDD